LVSGLLNNQDGTVFLHVPSIFFLPEWTLYAANYVCQLND